MSQRMWCVLHVGVRLSERNARGLQDLAHGFAEHLGESEDGDDLHTINLPYVDHELRGLMTPPLEIQPCFRQLSFHGDDGTIPRLRDK